MCRSRLPEPLYKRFELGSLRPYTNSDQVAPPHQREQVPLGSSSASMYPGYSPADHEYGKAAEEYGKAAAEARAKGVDVKHPDAEYVVGQGKGVKRKSLVEMREAQAAKNQSGTASGSQHPTKQELKEPSTTNGQASTEKIQEATPEGDNPYFIIDTKPTPVNIPGMSVKPFKRSASPPEGAEATVHKKAKKKHEGEMPKAEDIQEVKTEDISERVEARMKEKGEKRKLKEKKKRKREPEDMPAAAVEDSQSTAEASPIAGAEAESPKKKKVKAKKAEEESLPDRTGSTKRPSEEDGEAEDGEGKKKKKRKKSKGVATASDG